MEETRGSIPGSGNPPGEGNGNPLQNSCLGNPMDRGAWRATVHGVAKRVRHDLATKQWQSHTLMICNPESSQSVRIPYTRACWMVPSRSQKGTLNSARPWWILHGPSPIILLCTPSLKMVAQAFPDSFLFVTTHNPPTPTPASCQVLLSLPKSS